MELGLVRIVAALLQVPVPVLVRRSDRVVVAGDAAAAQDLLDQLLPVEGVLQRLAHVVVVERRLVGVHRIGEVLVARHLEDLDVPVALQQVRRLEVDPVDHVDLTGYQGGLAGVGIVDRQHFHGIEVAAVRLVVVVEAAGIQTHAGLEVLADVAAGADPLSDRLVLHPRRVDQDVVVAQEVGEVGVAVFQRKGDRVVIVLLHVLNRGDDRLGRGLRGLADVVLQRLDDVVRAEGLAVVELDASLELEGPDRRVVRGLPAFRQLAGQAAVGPDLGQAVEDHAVGGHLHEDVGVGPAVPAVRGVRARAADLDRAAPLGAGRERLAADQRGGQRRAAREGGRLRQEIPARDAVFRQRAFQLPEFVHTCLLLLLSPRPTGLERRKYSSAAVSVAATFSGFRQTVEVARAAFKSAHKPVKRPRFGCPARHMPSS